MERYFSILILMLFIIHAATKSNWESHHLEIIAGDNKTTITKLPYSQIWNVPTINHMEILVQNWEFTISEIYFLTLLYFSPIGITYLFFRNRVFDRLSTILSFIGLSMIVGTLLVILLYVIIGGWSLPGIIPIGTISIIAGLLIGVLKKNNFQSPT